MAFEMTDRRFDALMDGNEVIETDQYPFVRRLASDPNSIVVSIHGACRSNGQPAARGAYGAFFGTDSTLNRNGHVKIMSRQTNQYAELVACITAVETIRTLVLEGEVINHVVFRTNSENIWLGLTERVWDWQLRGWRKGTGKPVANSRAWRQLHRKLSLMEVHGVKVGVCLVDRTLNESAATLSKIVFGGSMPADRVDGVFQTRKIRKALRGRISRFQAPGAGADSDTLESRITRPKVPLEERIVRVKDEETITLVSTCSSATMAHHVMGEVY
ncbi:hypothetical protein BP5796_01872 [Coleophoma crateriformis]|uniref:ribonuclease H n=1 Tax=Coleophoma crateriformis TaxID=565419 RepID=A0A3D8T3A7_9HELO|nr:hypothetical protein BP5796_01872 [Coleophoma crateriformis]